MSYDVTDRLTITGGLRYSEYETSSTSGEFIAAEATEIPAQLQAFGVPARFASLADSVSPADSDSFSEDDISWRANVQYRPTDTSMVYFLVGTGYKPGGTTDAGGELQRIDPEKPISYEIGYKHNLPDRTFVSVAAFYTDVQDFQASVFDANTFTFPVQNIDVVTQGVEVDILSEPLDGLELRANFAYIDATLGDNVISECFITQEIAFIENGGTGPCTADISGNDLDNTPKFSLNAGGKYEMVLIPAALRGFISGDVTYTTERTFSREGDPGREQDGYAIFNAQIGVGAPQDQWEFTLWGKNIFDEEYTDASAPFAAGLESFGAPNPGFQGYMHRLGPPQTYGVRLNLRYN